jgi:hypothetical protein
MTQYTDETTHIRLKFDTLNELEELKKAKGLNSRDAVIKLLITEHKQNNITCQIFGPNGEGGKILYLDYLKKTIEQGLWAQKALESEGFRVEIQNYMLEGSKASEPENENNALKADE